MDVKTLCLGVLTMGEASGYEIKKVFEDSFSHFYVAGYGSIYPALAELTRLGYVTCSNIEQEKRPAKKVYRLTDAGLQAFREALESTYPSHRLRSDFMVLMVFAHLLAPESVGRVLDTRLNDIDRQLSLIDECEAKEEKPAPQLAFVSGFARTVLEAGKEYIEQHRDKLEQALRKQD